MPQFLIPFLALILTMGACFSNKITAETNQSMANAKLREGLQHLESGRVLLAEDSFKDGLALDPTNWRLRTSLASIYAGDAGIKLRDLMTPLYEVFNKFDGTDLTKLEKTQKSEIDLLSARLQGKLTEKEQKNKTRSGENQEKMLDNLKMGAEIMYSSATIAALMKILPYLAKDKLKKLDQAIQVLRETSVVPANRNEEERNYLGVLGAMRMVSTLKIFFGKDLDETIDLQKIIPIVCGMEQPNLQYALRDVRKSLVYMTEGLTNGPNDPAGKKRDKKQKFKNYVEKILASKFWTSIDDLLVIDYHKNPQLVSLVDVVCVSGF